ncbi:hypothetical protein NITGR_850008 [Nitrospina gracilis 3/211]|uniref:Uncharacterized protein n=1 Tax=Nitrospina gracilis (strain 3/211) TaxID=1266370 RepID=M1YMW5_NITG3|nr:hypothetical protein NITGR_850008 [Nitrospina gracilis 3/211]
MVTIGSSGPKTAKDGNNPGKRSYSIKRAAFRVKNSVDQTHLGNRVSNGKVHRAWKGKKERQSYPRLWAFNVQ